MTDTSQLVARFVEEFNGERAGANAGRIGLKYTINVADSMRRNAQSGADAANRRRRRRNKGIRAVVYVEHRALCALSQDRFAFAEEFVQLYFRVFQLELAHIFNACKPFLLCFGQIVIREIQIT